MADISIRTSIQWLPDPPSEPTSTLVLTSPGKHFVDVRILLPLDPSTPLTPERLDWAFAGTSSTTPLPSQSSTTSTAEDTLNPSGEARLVRSTWRHWVDSRHANAEGVVDEADMRIYPDGRSVETGRMVNPATGKETEYVEIWEEGRVEKGDVVVVLRTVGGDRGVVVRVGGYVQGMLRTGEEGAAGVSVGRWERGEKGEWWVVGRIGEGLDEVVGLVTGHGKGRRLSVGERVEAGGRTWEVLEVEGDV